MASAKDNVASTNEATLELITSIQQRIVDAQKEFAAAVSQLVPDVPKTNLTDAPDAKELVEESFAFQARLLEANRAFSLGLIEAWAQGAPNPGGTKTSKSSTSAKR